MAKPSFVGFQEQIEIPEGFELLEINEKIESSKSKDELFSLLSQPELISKWFYQIINLDSRPGGKVNFIGDEGSQLQAICTSVDLGREISFIADIFGNLSAKVVKRESSFFVELNFKILTDMPSQKRERILASVEKLRALAV